MAELSKTAAAAQKAVARGEKKNTKDRTWPEVLKGIRTNLDAKLAVTPGDVRQLLAAYEQLLAAYDSLITGAQAAPDAPEVFS